MLQLSQLSYIGLFGWRSYAEAASSEAEVLVMSNIVSAVAAVWYACKAGIAGGKARCRNQEGHCPSHPAGKEYAAAPRPTVVLFKVKLSPNARSRFNQVEADYKTWSERRQREAEHVQQAEALGRNPYGLRLESASDKPEAADSGCPIFGATSGGLKKVNVQCWEEEIRLAGFKMTGVSVSVTPGKQNQPPTSTLVLVFSIEGEEYTAFPWEEFSRLINASFAFVHIWANPTKADGTTVHTVNCLSRQEGQKPDFVLRYANGDWAAEPIAPVV